MLEIGLSIGFGLVSALAFRVRGGLWGERLRLGTTGARLIWAAVMAVLTCGAAGLNWWALITAPLWFVATLPGWLDSLDLGKNEGTLAQDSMAMLLRGVWWTYLPGLGVSFVVGTPPYVAALGVLCVPAYLAGAVVPIKVSGLHQGPELGEAIFGLVLGLGLFWSFHL